MIGDKVGSTMRGLKCGSRYTSNMVIAESRIACGTSVMVGLA